MLDKDPQGAAAGDVNTHDKSRDLDREVSRARGHATVVSGFSLRLPESDTVVEFWHNLMAGRDMVNDVPRNWDPEAFGVPRRYGKVRTFDQFDSQFFDIPPKQAEKLDPQVRNLLEVCQEALLDAAINPAELAGSNTGVFVGACGSDVMSNNVNSLDKLTGYEATGCATSMFANRLSHQFNLKGPSLALDTACSSSLTAFDLAYRAVATGQCERAIVGGSSFIFHPLWSVGFNNLNMLSPEGRCMAFNDAAQGFVRADGVVVLVLTREDLARKKYARVLASRCNNDGFTEQGITFPNIEAQKSLIRDLYQESGLHPNSVDYAEAHGTGTAVGDPVELNAIDQVLFGELKRTKPLLVGSVKSNMGHSEGASGLAGVAKVLLAMVHETIPANLYGDNPNKQITGLWNGHLEIVDHHRPFKAGIASVSSFGFGGSNAHIVLEKIAPEGVCDGRVFPMPLASRTAAGRAALREEIVQSADDGDSSALLTALHRVPLEKHPFRGFVLKEKGRGEVLRVERDEPPAGRPVWLVLNGVGSQWHGMGQALPDLPIARATLERCQRALAKHGIDLHVLLNSDDPALWRDPVHIFAAVAAIQIVQYECIRALGIKVEGYFGHSVGELVCAYIDGATDLEQTLDIAYYRGLGLNLCSFESGAMAVVQTDLETLRARLPDDVEIGCHNAQHSFTVTGSSAALTSFAEMMALEGLPCKVVDTGGIPFHSRLISGVRDTFEGYLRELLPAPRARSDRWLSSSRVTEDSRRQRVLAASRGPDKADVEFFVTNLLGPVLFSQCLARVPADAIVIEVGPHGLLKSQCRADIPGCDHVVFGKRHAQDHEAFWRGLGELHCLGVPMNWAGLLAYLRAENPLVRIEQLAAWDHRRSWPLPDIVFGGAFATDFVEDWVIDIDEPDNAFVKDHIVNGNPIFPGVGYLHLVWRTIAKWQRRDPETLAVEFRNIRFVRASIFRSTTRMKLTIKIDTIKDTFCVIEADQLVADGEIVTVGGAAMSRGDFPSAWRDEPGNLERSDVYRLFVRTGIAYGHLFRGISLVSANREHALVDWTLNWPTYFDATLQLLFVGSKSDTIGVPRSIDTFRFDPTRLDDRANIPARIRRSEASVRTPCVEIEGVTIHSNYVPDLDYYELHTVDFKPYFAASPFAPDVREYLDVCRDLVLHNLHRVLTVEDLSHLPDVDHLDAIRESLGASLDVAAPAPALVERYRDEADAPMLRLILHVFDRWEELVADAMPLMLSHPEYASSYRDDRTYRKRSEILENMLELVVQNTDEGVLRSLEIGAGTGALTSVALPYLAKYAVSYQVSDLSAGYFVELSREFELYAAKTSYVLWDANEPAPGDDYDLILGSNAVHTVRNIGHTLGHIASSLKEGGFFLVEEMTGDFWFSLGLWGFIREFWTFDDERTCGMYLARDEWVEAAAKVGLELVMSHDVGGSLSYLLFRKPVRTVARELPFDSLDAEGLATLQGALAGRERGETLWLVGRESEVPGLDGFARSAANEAHRIRGLLIVDDTPPPESEVARTKRADLISNIWRDGRMGSHFRTGWAEHPRRGLPEDTNYQIRTLVPGDLTSVRRVPDWVTRAESPKATVVCFPVNFKDAMLASGRISSSVYKPFGEAIGLEYGGVLDDGTRVIGLNLSHQGISQRVAIDNPLTYWPIPDGMSLEAACTIPVAYATAWTGLVLRARARAGQRVFIHSGAGSVGQAAIQIATNLGLDVFTTTGSDEKKTFLLERFPGLDPAQILYSRSTEFYSQIMEMTDGRGVDIVLNSFSEERLMKSLELLGKYGHFVDISRYDAFKNSALPMRHFLRNISYTNIALDEMYRDDHPEVEDIHGYIGAALANGEIPPISHSTSEGVVHAMQELLRGDTIGKLVVDMDRCQAQLDALDVFACSPDKRALVTGGLGGVGLELCQWLISRGCRDLVIASRSVQLTPFQALKVESWRSQGVAVDITEIDLSRPELASDLLRTLESEKPLGAVFHLAMVLRDRMLSEYEYEDFMLPIRVKAAIADSIDRATRAHCPQLEHFVMFSSVIAFYGNEGQSNYGYANSAIERLCVRRHSEGLPGLAIEWGALGDVGFVAREEMENAFSHLGMEAMGILSVLDSLDSLLMCDSPIVSAYSPVTLVARSDGEEVSRNLLGDVLQIMGFQEAPDQGEDRTLSELGVDSLMIVEINQILSRDYGLSLAPKQIRELTPRRLAEMSDDAGGRTTEHGSEEWSRPSSVEAQARVPLTGKQLSMLRHSQMSGGDMFMVQNLFEADAGDIHSWTDTIVEIFQRYATFGRTTVGEVGAGEAVLELDGGHWPKSSIVLTFDEPHDEAALSRRLDEDRAKGFDLERGPLWRLLAIRRADAPSGWTFSLTMHHILADGWSVLSMVLELDQRLSGAATRAPIVDYATTLRALQARPQAPSKRFWQDYLSEADPFLLPDRRTTDTPMCTETAKVRFQLQRSGIERARQRFGVTTSTLVQAAWAVALSRHGHTDHVMFGLTESGRGPDILGIDKVVGCLINTLPVRVALASELPLVEWLRALAEETEMLLAHGGCRSGATDPGDEWFGSVLVVESFSIASRPELHPRNFTGFRWQEKCNYPIQAVVLLAETYTATITFDLDRFDAASINRLRAGFSGALDELCAAELDASLRQVVQS